MNILCKRVLVVCVSLLIGSSIVASENRGETSHMAQAFTLADGYIGQKPVPVISQPSQPAPVVHEAQQPIAPQFADPAPQDAEQPVQQPEVQGAEQAAEQPEVSEAATLVMDGLTSEGIRIAERHVVTSMPGGSVSIRIPGQLEVRNGESQNDVYLSQKAANDSKIINDKQNRRAKRSLGALGLGGLLGMTAYGLFGKVNSLGVFGAWAGATALSMFAVHQYIDSQTNQKRMCKSKYKWLGALGCFAAFVGCQCYSR